ncbi:hypothetical protein GNQ08_18315 [Paenibacillus macerans]|uniref:Uncharacterized protein n=1 Tax=Paenibacillus macerans TaxID=44252 RepID=A0A6N8EW95_PAEMA|nr:hypothetical protein [Paenibacillus macerans]MED4954513.1 hypothetical protein [Paenibacillus macerans]MUG24337.1 hypothetical protein [Paenibacillus macerans]UMV50346.1 hypothetical protein LMZ02_13770 [Paenibacillus macerans]
MRDMEKLIEQVDGTMAMEGMPLTQDDKDRIRHCAGNDKLVEETIAKLIKKHAVIKEHPYEQQL